jgi:hypothetical protein
MNPRNTLAREARDLEPALNPRNTLTREALDLELEGEQGREVQRKLGWDTHGGLKRCVCVCVCRKETGSAL